MIFASISTRLKRQGTSVRLFMGVSLVLGGGLAAAQSANRLKAIELVKEAATLFERGNIPLVIKVCRQALILDPTYPRAYTWLGAAYQRRGERQNACAAFGRVLKLAPNTPDSQRAARGIRELGCGVNRQVKVLPIKVRLENRWAATSGIASLAFSNDGAFVSSGGSDGSWRLWRLPDGRLDRLERGDGYEATAAASSPNFYAIGSGSGNIRLYDARQGREAGQIGARSGSVGSLAYAPGGRLLVAAGADGALKIFDGTNNSLLRQIPGDGFLVSSATFSPDGRFIAAAVGSVVRVYEASSGRLLRVLTGDGLPFGPVVWSRNGAFIAAASGYRIRVWFASNGRLARILLGHRLTVTALSFGSGNILASGGYDAQLRLWNAQTGANLANLALHSGQIRGLAFDFTGKRLVSSDQKGLVGLWRLS